jgi:hypothetical protein
MRFIVLVMGLCIGGAASACAFQARDGHVAQAGKFHVELFVNGRDVTLYFWDRAERPLDASSVRATAQVRSAEGEATVYFVPIGESLQGHAPFAIGRDATISVTFSVFNDPDEQARFSLGSEPDDRGHKH